MAKTSSGVDQRFVGAILLAASTIFFAGGAALSFSSRDEDQLPAARARGFRAAAAPGSIAPSWQPEDPRLREEEDRQQTQATLHRRAVVAILLFGVGILFLATGGHVVGLTSSGRADRFPDA